jgi:signal transduction histidine kinase
VPAEPRNAYYPLTWQSQTNGLNVPIGFDFSSLGEEARRAIEQIERTRRPALVLSPVSDFSAALPIGNRQSAINNRQSAIGNSPSPSYWVFAPVILGQVKPNTIPPSGSVIGFSVAVLHPEAILNRVAALAGPASKFRMTLQPVPPDANPEQTIQRIKGGWLYRHPLEAINTQWIFECSMPAETTGHRSLFALLIGLLITALMTSQLLFLSGRTRKIEAKVLARTEDLRVANVRLEENLHERARLEEEMNELAARERRRIGRDLHDSLGQKLTGAVFLSRSLLNWFQEHGAQKTEDRGQKTEDGANPPDTRHSTPLNNPAPLPAFGPQADHAETLNETLKSAVGQVRNMARGLAPVTLNDESLCEALEQLAEEMTGLYGVSCEVAKCDDLSALGQKTKEQLYLIAREAVNNAARHAQAGHVTIRLTGSESGWKLCVEDDGKGIPEILPSREGMGIRIMRHRAGLIGAKFAMNSAPGRGTCVEITSIA